MSLERWTEVDQYIDNLFAPTDPVLDAALRTSTEAGLPPIQVSPNQGKLLAILAQSIQARIYSGNWCIGWVQHHLAGSRPGARREDDYPRSGPQTCRRGTQPTWSGPAWARRWNCGLAQLWKPCRSYHQEGQGPFDLVFIDADKPNCAAYFEWALKLSHPGSLIITDNVVRNGAVADPTSRDPGVQGVRKFNATLACRAARERYRGSDRRQQGLRWVCHRSG